MCVFVKRLSPKKALVTNPMNIPASRLGRGPGAKMTTRVSREPHKQTKKRPQKKKKKKKAGWVILLIHDASLWKITTTKQGSGSGWRLQPGGDGVCGASEECPKEEGGWGDWGVIGV